MVKLRRPSQLGPLNTPTASLQRGKIPPHNECPRYDTKLSDGEARLMLELWRMWSTASLSSLPGPLWSGVAASDRVLSIGQIELFDHLNYEQKNDLCFIEFLEIEPFDI